jgi:hypothetical protein
LQLCRTINKNINSHCILLLCNLPIHNEFGFKGLITASQAVLGGVYEAKVELDQYTKAVLEELSMPPAIHELGSHSMLLSVESYRSFWKKANERISCYVAEMSFATMKAGATDEVIAEFECEMLNIPLDSGYNKIQYNNQLQ